MWDTHPEDDLYFRRQNGGIQFLDVCTHSVKLAKICSISIYNWMCNSQILDFNKKEENYMNCKCCKCKGYQYILFISLKKNCTCILTFQQFDKIYMLICICTVYGGFKFFRSLTWVYLWQYLCMLIEVQQL